MAIETNSAPTRRAVTESGLTAEEFDRLYQDQWPSVLSYVRLRVGDADGHDIAAEAFTRAWSHKDAYDGDRGTGEAWLWTIVRNATIDHIRGATEPASSGADHEQVSRDLEAHVSARLDMQRTLAAVGTLPTTDRELIALRFGAGLTNRAIGEMLSLSEGNVAVRLHRALRRVRLELEAEQEGHHD